MVLFIHDWERGFGYPRFPQPSFFYWESGMPPFCRHPGHVTSHAIGEEGFQPPRPGLGYFNPQPPQHYTTLALGEEGHQPPGFSYASFETGQGYPYPQPPPQHYTTLALGEEGYSYT